jgi:diaminohydroxyphosphoribosylaminopyrimidine deaminase/5-amino-6-(5-phosphoribosylamino)uracil reductase
MRRALNLARMAEGRTSPNPMVGAVLTRDGRVVGEGYHHRAGEPHAEVEALRAAGDLARGATLYVTLEPCAHQGRTPPCTDALVAAAVAQVYFAISDPDPRVNGKGQALLEAAGIVVHRGLCEADARKLNQAYFKYVRTGRPLVTVKFAMSLDGRIATRSGDSRWISSEASRRRVHELRSISDAILVGAGTMLADDPLLTARVGSVDESEIRQPTRYILDSRGRVPTSARAFDPSLPGEAVLVTTSAAPERFREELAARGVEVLVLPATPNLRVSLADLMDEIGRRGALTLLVEGGAEINGAFLDAGLADRVWAFIAPMILGAAGAPGPVGGTGVERVSDAIRLTNVETEMLESDLWVRGDVETNLREDG